MHECMYVYIVRTGMYISMFFLMVFILTNIMTIYYRLLSETNYLLGTLKHIKLLLPSKFC